jgi:hypothetical protein
MATVYTRQGWNGIQKGFRRIYFLNAQTNASKASMLTSLAYRSNESPTRYAYDTA